MHGQNLPREPSKASPVAPQNQDDSGNWPQDVIDKQCRLLASSRDAEERIGRLGAIAIELEMAGFTRETKLVTRIKIALARGGVL